MTLTLYFHPLASFCHKVLVALYENDTSFNGHIVNLGDPDSASQFKAVWPIGKMPVLHDSERRQTVPESSIIIEYLAQYYPGPVDLLPSDPDRGRETRFQDRLFDLYVHEPMQKIVVDRIRPPEKTDPYGVEQAKVMLQTAYDLIDDDMTDKTWATGDAFTMADCAAAPALFYANEVIPFRDSHKNIARYFDRLLDRPSFARVLEEAQPYFHLFPR